MSRTLSAVAALLLLVTLSACDPDETTLEIDSFGASPAMIAVAGQPVVLSWDVSGPVTGLEIVASGSASPGPVTGESVTVYPDATTTYTLTASNSSSSVEASTMVTVGSGGGDGDPTGTFGVSASASGPFLNDAGGGITGPTDDRVLTVPANSTFYIQASYSDPDGISSIVPHLANDNKDLDLVPGIDVRGFTASEPTDCAFDGTQTEGTCTFAVEVGNIPNITGVPEFTGEFAYVFKATVVDGAGNEFKDTLPRAYVIVSGGSDPTDPTNPDPTDPTTPDPTDPTTPDPTDPTTPGDNRDPVAAFSAEQVDSDESVAAYRFSALGSSDPDGDALSYDWDFGDGTGASSRDYTKLYTSDGTYTVALTVDDGKGGSDTASKTLTVDVPGDSNQAPVASFTYSPTTVVVNDPPGQGTVVTFNPSSSNDADGTVSSYDWTVKSPTGAPSTFSSSPLRLRFSQVGDYQVTLVVEDNDGATSEPVTQTVTVLTEAPNEPPVANAGNDLPEDGDTILPGEPVTLNGSGTDDGTVEGYKWTLTPSAEASVAVLDNDASQTPSFTPDLPGMYTATLTVTDDAGVTSEPDEVTITVAEPPAP